MAFSSTKTWIALAALALAAPAAHAQQIVQNYTGTGINNLPGLNNGGEFIPPDTQGAIGASSLVELVNGAYSAYSKTNGSLLQQSSLDTFWANAGITPTGGAFDPRVVYDPTAQRYYASSLDFGPTDANNNQYNNDILLAVSNSSDPTAGWKAIKIGASQGTDNFFADFDTLGYNANGVFVSVNDFTTTGPSSGDPDGDLPPLSPNGAQNATSDGVSFLTAPKASLLAQTTAGTTLTYNVSPNSTGFVSHPVVDQDNGANTEYLFSSYNSNYNGTGYDKLAFLTNTAATPTLNSGSFVTTAGFNGPPPAQQPNGDNTIDTGDTRFGSSVVKVNGEIWAVQTVSVNGHAGLNWVRLNASTGQLISQGTISDASHDYYYGSVAVNGQGSVVIGYTRSGGGEFASSYASVGAYSAATVTFQNPLLLKAGVGDYDLTFGGSSNRWGDYSATTVDPNDPSKFWTVQEWASGMNTASGPGNGAWSTQITEIGISAAPEPSSLAAMGIGAFVLAGCIARKRRSLPA